MRRILFLLSLSLPFLLAAPALLLPQPAFGDDAQAADACLSGNYRLDDGTNLDIAPPDEGAMRWKKFDGSTGALHRQADGSWTSTRGWTEEADGIVASFAGCGGNTIRFAGVAGTRTEFDVHEVRFDSHGTSLAGRLVLPRGDAPVTVVVLIHGSEPDSAMDSYSLQRVLPAEGIGAFVYDKRGTGKSGGHYTQDYSLLADDAAAAVATVRAQAGARLGRIGFQGGSQAGWVVPLAASRTKVDFAIVCFGLAVNAIDEDQQAVELQLREKGYSPAEIRDAQRVARAAEKVMASDMSQGFAELDKLRARYSGARWYKDLRGDYTWLILPHSEAELRAQAKDFDWHTPWQYDPMPVLRASRTPQLWVLGGEDYEAPSAETRKRLQGLIRQGHDYTIAYYRNAEHGMTLFETDAKGERLSTRFAPGYFQLLRDFALHGAVSGPYGDAELSLPQRRQQ
jgi:pimeloyl-ACP methyl ester carboxylesterase